MIGNLIHLAIAVPDLALAIRQYGETFGAFVTSPQDLPEHGVRRATVKLPNTTLELITPLGKNSPLQEFLEKNVLGGVHHLCYEVTNLLAAQNQLASAGLHVIGDGTPKLGYRGYPVLFFHPRDCLGVLIELEEVPFSQAQAHIEVERVGRPSAHTFHHPSSATLEGVEGVGIGVDVDFRHMTPKSNEEEN